MASPSFTYTLANSTTADASQVMQDFNDILNGVTDGTKDLSISALTCAGTATLNGHVNLGNSSADDLTITASLASSLAIKTNNTYDIGSSTLGLRKLYLGNGGAGATCDIVAASHATTREYTVPDCGAAANFLMSQLAQTASGIKTFSDGVVVPTGRTAGTATDNAYAGTYTPTISDVTNIGTSTPALWFWVRVGDVVTVAGRLDIDPVATGRWTVYATCPVTTSFAAAGQAGGYIGGINATGNNTGTVVARASNNQVVIDAFANHTSSLDYYIHFSYRVV